MDISALIFKLMVFGENCLPLWVFSKNFIFVINFEDLLVKSQFDDWGTLIWLGKKSGLYSTAVQAPDNSIIISINDPEKE